MKRGQSAIEFVVLASFMLLFFAISLIYVQKTMVDFTAAGKQAAADAVREAVVRELGYAANMPEGYTRTFNLPDTIQGLSYTITVQTENEPLKDSLVVQIGDESIIWYLDENVTGTLHPGANTLQKTSTIILN